MGNEMLKLHFIDRATKIHNSKYSYDEIEKDCFHTEEKIKIKCPIHGVFEQTPHSHLKGFGCYKCGRISTGNKTLNTKEYLIKKFREIHGDTYDYSLVEYKGAGKKIKIICKKHGVFEMRATSHYDNGCKKCKFESKVIPYDVFLKRAREVHGNRYSYCKDTYKTMSKHMIIICKTHGRFKQVPTEHVRGRGCKLCRQSHGERKIEEYLKKNKIRYKREYSIKKFPYRFDFYIPKYKLLIEYDGIQHFEEVARFGKHGSLERVRKRDALKNKIAKKYGYKLLRINYKEMSMIRVILDKMFRNLLQPLSH